jgi:hypothetical protein
MMELIKIDIDQLLESTRDLTSENNTVKTKRIEIDRLLDLTRE